MTLRRAARSGLLLCVLCLFGGASTALAASGHRSRDRPSHSVRACHRTKHHRCPKSHTGRKTLPKHKHGASSKRSAQTPGGISGGSGTTVPWATVPPSVAPGSTPVAGTTPPGSNGGAPPAETPTAPAGPVHVEVTAEDTAAYHFVLSRPTVPAGEVIIEFVNHGQDEHNLNTLEPGGEPAPGGSLPKTAPNAHPTLSLNLHAGSYTLFCSLPHHEEKGMKATLVVN